MRTRTKQIALGLALLACGQAMAQGVRSIESREALSTNSPAIYAPTVIVTEDGHHSVYTFAPGSTDAADGVTILTADGGRWMKLNIGGSTSTNGAVTSVNTQTGDVVLTKTSIGLPAVDNTADTNKPVSIAQAAALAGKASTNHTQTASTITDFAATVRSVAGDASILSLAARGLTITGNNAASIVGVVRGMVGQTSNIFEVQSSNNVTLFGVGPSGAVTAASFTGEIAWTNLSDVPATATVAALGDLTDAGESTLHYHAADRARGNHTGTQTASTISDFSEAVDDRAAALIVAGANITATYNDAANTLTIAGTGGTEGAVTSVASRTGDVVLTKTDVGLANVDNTSDANKPVSTATATALSGKAATSHTQAASTISDSTAAGRSMLTAADSAAQRSLLTLGGASLLNVGTSSGTVAAGNDSRFLSTVNLTDLTDAGDSVLHYHAGDRARANHTGSQAASTISDFAEAVDDRAAALIVAGANITATYNDAGNTLTIASTASGSGLTDGDKGDITVGGSGTTMTIDAGAVSLAKMANLSAPSLLIGRYSAGAGAPQPITVGSGLAVSSGGVMTATGSGGGALPTGMYDLNTLGAVGNGIQNNTTVFAAAFAAGGTYYLGPGVYLTDAMTTSKDITIIGVPSDTGVFPTIKPRIAITHREGFFYCSGNMRLENLRFEGNSLTHQMYGIIYNYDCERSQFRNVQIANWTIANSDPTVTNPPRRYYGIGVIGNTQNYRQAEFLNMTITNINLTTTNNFLGGIRVYGQYNPDGPATKETWEQRPLTRISGGMIAYLHGGVDVVAQTGESANGETAGANAIDIGRNGSIIIENMVLGECYTTSAAGGRNIGATDIIYVGGDDAQITQTLIENCVIFSYDRRAIKVQNSAYDSTTIIRNVRVQPHDGSRYTTDLDGSYGTFTLYGGTTLIENCVVAGGKVVYALDYGNKGQDADIQGPVTVNNLLVDVGLYDPYMYSRQKTNNVLSGPLEQNVILFQGAIGGAGTTGRLNIMNSRVVDWKGALARLGGNVTFQSCALKNSTLGLFQITQADTRLSVASCDLSTDTGVFYLTASNGKSYYSLTDCHVENRNEIAVSSITRVGTQATCTTAVAHGRTTGDSVRIQGATPSPYNGTAFTITVTSPTTFTYTMSSDPGASASVAASVGGSIRMAHKDNWPAGGNDYPALFYNVQTQGAAALMWTGNIVEGFYSGTYCATANRPSQFDYSANLMIRNVQPINYAW